MSNNDVPRPALVALVHHPPDSACLVVGNIQAAVWTLGDPRGSVGCVIPLHQRRLSGESVREDFVLPVHWCISRERHKNDVVATLG
jgi:hypothetical protein